MALEIVALMLGLVMALFIHELGHLFAARCCNVGVDSISIGVGPKLITHRDRDGTQWTLHLLPVGAHCRIGAALLGGASPAQRASIFLAGPVFSVTFAVALIGALTIAHGWPASGAELTVRPDFAVGASIALFSVALGLFNLLPLWPLDGGHLTLIALDACGRPAGPVVKARFATGSLWVLRLGSAGVAAMVVWFVARSWI